MKVKKHISLSEIPKRNAFLVPNGYFEELPAMVLAKCSVSKVERNVLFRTSQPLWWRVAACFVLLLGIWFVVPDSSTPSGSSSQTEASSSLSREVGEYLAQHADPVLLENELIFTETDFLPEEELTEDEVLAYLDYCSFAYDDIE